MSPLSPRAKAAGAPAAETAPAMATAAATLVPVRTLRERWEAEVRMLGSFKPR